MTSEGSFPRHHVSSQVMAPVQGCRPGRPPVSGSGLTFNGPSARDAARSVRLNLAAAGAVFHETNLAGPREAYTFGRAGYGLCMESRARGVRNVCKCKRCVPAAYILAYSDQRWVPVCVQILNTRRLCTLPGRRMFGVLCSYTVLNDFILPNRYHERRLYYLDGDRISCFSCLSKVIVGRIIYACEWGGGGD